MLNDKFFEVLKHEGVVSVVTWGNGEPNITNTWNSYLQIKDGNRILIPAAGFSRAEKDINVNDKVKIALGSRQVMGNNNYQGTGFLIEGTGKFLTSGEDFDFMIEKFPFLTRVFEITVTLAKQLL
jgi:FMN-binding protein